jgi:hypothetical protein
MSIEIDGSGVITGVDSLSTPAVTNAAGSASAPSITFTGDSNTGIYSPAADTIAFTEGGVESVRLDSSGRVGIGTTAPTAKLVCDGSIQVTNSTNPSTGAGLELGYGTVSPGRSAFQSYNRTGSAWLGLDYNALDHYFYTSATERLRIDSSGRLLVGTSTTSSVLTNLLQGNSSSSTGDAILKLAIGTATPANNDTLGRIAFTDSGHSDSAQIIALRDGGTWSGSSKPSRLTFSTTADGASSPTERMRISNGGELLTFSDANQASYTWRNGSTAGTSIPFVTALYGASSTTSGGTISLRIWTNGNIQNTNNSYTAISDIKLKENIVDAGSQWDDLKALRVRKYNFKEGQTHTQIGLIAQEVELVSPGLVSESPDRDEEGNDLGTVTKSVNYSVLYMKAVKALQEAMERIETLEASNADLLARVSVLEQG